MGRPLAIRTDLATVAERQALPDAVLRYNEEGVGELRDRPKPGRRPRLSDAEQASLRAVILCGPGGGRELAAISPVRLRVGVGWRADASLS